MFVTFKGEKPSTTKPESTQAINAANVPDTLKTIPKYAKKGHNVLLLAGIKQPPNPTNLPKNKTLVFQNLQIVIPNLKMFQDQQY